MSATLTMVANMINNLSYGHLSRSNSLQLNRITLLCIPLADVYTLVIVDANIVAMVENRMLLHHEL